MEPIVVRQHLPQQVALLPVSGLHPTALHLYHLVIHCQVTNPYQAYQDKEDQHLWVILLVVTPPGMHHLLQHQLHHPSTYLLVRIKMVMYLQLMAFFRIVHP